jgi:hypothetical protein
MPMTRKEFCEILGGSTVVLLFQACGGGGSSYSGPAPPPAPAACGSSGTAIAGNHGHVLTIARADLDSMVAMTYSIAGIAGHDHMVSFSPAQLQTLKTGGAVTVTSTTGDGGLGPHTHNVTASCP